MNTQGDDIGSVQSFARGLSVIRCFGEGANRLTLTEVAKKAGLSRAGARRLLHTLCNEKYAATDGKWFWLTPRILDLGYSYLSSMELWGFAQEYLERLRARLEESTSIAVLDGHDVVYVMRAQTKRMLAIYLGVGSRLPAYATSLGRIQLAYLPEDRLKQYLDQVQLEKFTPYTINSIEELRQTLERERENGYSIVSRELELGISGVAMPVRDRLGRTIAAISCNFRPDKADEPGAIDQILEQLAQARNEIEAVLAMR